MRYRQQAIGPVIRRAELGIGFRPDEVGQHVLDVLRDVLVALPMEQQAAVRDLVLRLQAEEDRLARGGGQRLASCPGLRHLQVLRDA